MRLARPTQAAFTTTSMLLQSRGHTSCGGLLARGSIRQFAAAANNNNNNSRGSPNVIVKLPKLKVVLDMDECLIHSRFVDQERHRSSSVPSDMWRQDEERQRHVAHEGIESFKVELEDPEDDDVKERVVVNKRPKLDDFLLRVSDEYDVYVFTAGVEAYANKVLDELDPTGAFFTGRFYRQHCKMVGGFFLKDLTKITPNLSRVVLVDNNPVSFVMQPSNGIPVPNFYDDPQDQSLEHVNTLIERYLHNAEDVRQPLDRFFQLRQRLSSIRQNLLGDQADKQDEEVELRIEEQQYCTLSTSSNSPR